MSSYFNRKKILFCFNIFIHTFKSIKNVNLKKVNIDHKCDKTEIFIVSLFESNFMSLKKFNNVHIRSTTTPPTSTHHAPSTFLTTTSRHCSMFPKIQFDL